MHFHTHTQECTSHHAQSPASCLMCMQYPFTGTATDTNLMQWLDKYTFATEGRFQDLEYARQIYSKARGSTVGGFGFPCNGLGMRAGRLAAGGGWFLACDLWARWLADCWGGADTKAAVRISFWTGHAW
jgi:hypothetical protein